MNFLETLMSIEYMELLFTALKIILMVTATLLTVALVTWYERKVLAHIQVRMGPMEVGYHGLLQPFADLVKFFFKEDVIPSQADKPIFFIAPVICILAALSSLAVIPFYEDFVIADINIGLLFVLGMSSLNAYGVVLAGWASNSNYAFLGGLRSSAQVISYEISLGLSLVGVMMLSGTMNLHNIVMVQQALPSGMYVSQQFIGFFIFIVAALAETNRVPFDLPEAENELVAGYFTEYSGMRFAMFVLAEYIGMLLLSAIGVICFLGGWTLPPVLVDAVPFLANVPGGLVLGIKIFFFMFMYFWVRATLPRYRYDQLMKLGWQFLLPLALFNVVLTGILKFI
jgi:NADH-quinone oxidoreductase subunit H